MESSASPGFEQGTKIQPKVCLTEVFGNRLGSWTFPALGSWMSAPKCLFSQGFEGPDRSFGPGYPRE